jgi:Spy/CpxP family protein refolding chaperone
MRHTLITLVGLGAVALGGAASATAQPFGPGEGRRGPEGMHGPGRFLELTEEQQAAARELFEQQRPQREALRAELRENRQALRQALEGGSPDPCVVGELVIEGHALEERGRAQREESKEALGALLNAEQKRKLEVLEAARALRGPGGRPGMAGRRDRQWGPREKGAELE